MTLDSYFAVVESLPFQVQFSVLSGIQSVQRALAQDETVRGLLEALTSQPKLAEQVFERIKHLLPLTKIDTGLSLDESIVAYLFCLKRHDLNLARRASHLIWETGGLWWSAQLAHQIIAVTRQIEESLNFASDAYNIRSFVRGAAAQGIVAKGVSNTSIHEFAKRVESLEPVELSFAG